jgi:hypothetical protein
LTGQKKKKEFVPGPYGAHIPQEAVVYLSRDVVPYFFNGNTPTTITRDPSIKEDEFYFIDEDTNMPTFTAQQLRDALNRGFGLQTTDDDIFKARVDLALTKILYQNSGGDYSFIENWVRHREPYNVEGPPRGQTLY